MFTSWGLGLVSCTGLNIETGVQGHQGDMSQRPFDPGVRIKVSSQKKKVAQNNEAALSNLKLRYKYGNNFQKALLLVIEECRFRMEGQMVDKMTHFHIHPS